MAMTSVFGKDSLLKVFKNSFLSSTNDNLSYSVGECSENNNIFHLNVSLENEHSNRNYLLVRLLTVTDLKRKKDECLTFLNSVFTVEDTTENVYLGFEKKNLFYPCRNDVEILKVILKSLAKSQVQSLAKRRTNCATIATKYDITNIVKTVMSLDMFNLFDFTDISSKLQQPVDQLMQSDFGVKSVGNIFAANVFIGESEECTFLKLGDESLRSPVHDALSFIFAFADDHFRQRHMKKLLGFYYHSFVDLLKDVNNSIALNFTENMFENHVKILLPLIKFEAAFYLIKEPNFALNQNCFNNLLKNIEYFLKYPQLNYEDCLEAVSNKLESSDFELLDYQLVPLQEKYGHLGEYWFLKTEVRHSNQKKHFSMFTKVLNLDHEVLRTLVHSGLSQREQFFYRSLLPQLEEYGFKSLVDFIPKYYFDRLNDVIIMEDLAELGYKPFKPDARFQYDDLKIIFNNCAKFHACSLLLEDRMTKSNGKPIRLDNIYGKYLDDVVFTIREGVPIPPAAPSQAKPGIEQLLDSFTFLFEKESKDTFYKKVDDLLATLSDGIGASKKFRNVICHGDFYSSNLLAKYDHDGALKRISFVDFQVLRYAPPTQDLLFIVYHNTNKDVRDKYLDRLLSEYYQMLKNSLREFEVDINTIYTPDQFSECVAYMKPIAICMALLYCPVTNVPSEQKEEIFFNEEKHQFYFVENRRQYIEYMLSISDHFTTVSKALIQDLYNAIIN